MGQRAIAISDVDLPASGRPLIHGCEDCACAVSATGSRLIARPLAAERVPGLPLVRADDTVELVLDEEYRLLFRPAGNGGVVVVNEPAYQVFRQFDQPATLSVMRARLAHSPDEIDRVAARLRGAGIISHPGEAVLPGFAEPDSRTLTAWLHVSNACNLACPYCYVDKSAAGMDERAGTAAVDAVISSALAHGFQAVKLKYAGGEASLNSDLVLRLDAYARAAAAGHGLELHATLLSNGVALPRAFTESLAAAGVKIMISLDGVGGPHDAQRPTVAGKPSFRAVERTIARLVEQGCPPHLSITITARNASGVADAVRFALDRDLTFSLNFFRDNECATGFADLRYTDEQMISGMLAAFAVIGERVPSWSVLGSVLDRGQLLEPRQRPCGVGHDYVAIDHEGKVAKCHMEIERTLGDVFRDDPLELVRRDTRTTLNLLVEEKEGCRECTWRHWCSGGCPVATFRATGRYDLKSPNCAIYKAIYPEALRLEGLRLLKYGAAEQGAPPAQQGS
jgi:uncharacterized protein